MAPRRIAVILPHLGLYGGNLRYIELGNELVARGFDFAIATPTGDPPEFTRFAGRVATFEELRRDPPDVLLASEQNLFDTLRALPAERKFYYFIIENTAREAEIARAPDVKILANSSGMTERLRRRYGVDVTPVIGGVNARLFRPLEDGERELRVPGSFRVVANGRFVRRKKGTRIVASAVDRLARRGRLLELNLFDTATVDHVAGLPQNFRCRARVRLDLDVPRDRLRIVYGSGDVFVSAEKKAGWSNPTIEAMACGVPVVCTKGGTRDFARHEETALIVPRTVWHVKGAIRRLMRDESLRDRLARAGLERARSFSWERTAEQLSNAIDLG